MKKIKLILLYNYYEKYKVIEKFDILSSFSSIFSIITS